jgi:chromate reductase
VSASPSIRVLGIAGSLRSASYNRALLRAAVDLTPEGVEILVFDRLGEFPLLTLRLRGGR